MKFEDYLLTEAKADAFWLCRVDVRRSGKYYFGYVVWRVQDFLNAYDFAKGKNIDSVTNSINRKCKADGDPFYRVYAEVKGVTEPEQIKLYKDDEDAILALSRVCPKAAALLGKKGVVQMGESKFITEGDNSYYLLIKSRYSTNFKHTMKQYLVWTKKDLQTYEPKAYGSTMDAAIATFNKVREDREEEEYIESLGAIESSKRYTSKETDTLQKAKADIIKISPEAKAALTAVSGSLKEAKKVYYLLLKRRTNDQLGKSFYKFMVWTLADLKAFSNRAKGASMERAVNAYNNSASAYLEVIGEVSGVTEPAESGDKTDIAVAKSEIISQCPAVKSMVQNVRESLTEGEFIPVKDLEAQAKKLNPQKEAKLKAALAKVDAAREKVNKFMKSYDSSDEKQRLERVKLGGELAAAMNAYLELV